MGKILTKRVWIGTAVSISVLMIGLVTGTSFLYRGMLPESSCELFLTVMCFVAVCGGGLIAAAGKHKRLLSGLIVCCWVYLLLWILTLSGEGSAAFDRHTLWITGTVWGGAILGSVLAPRSSRGNRKKKKRSPTAKNRNAR